MNIGARREDRTRRHYRSISKSQATELLAWAKYFTEPAFPGRQAEESSTPDRGMVISAGRRCVQSNLSVAGGFIGSCVLCQLFLSAEQTARGRNHTIDSWACAHRSQCHISISTTGATTETALASARSTCLITTCRTVNLRTVLSSGSSVLARTSAPKLTNGLFS